MADEDDDPEAGVGPLPPAGGERDATKLDLLREAGHDLTDEDLVGARTRLDRASTTITAESRFESRERVREIMGWSPRGGEQS